MAVAIPQIMKVMTVPSSPDPSPARGEGRFRRTQNSSWRRTALRKNSLSPLAGQRRPASSCWMMRRRRFLNGRRALQVVLHGQRHGLVELRCGAQQRAPQGIGRQRRQRRRQGDAAAGRAHRPAVVVVQMIGVEQGNFRLPARLLARPAAAPASPATWSACGSSCGCGVTTTSGRKCSSRATRSASRLRPLGRPSASAGRGSGLWRRAANIGLARLA
jgi:hypothetical protein